MDLGCGAGTNARKLAERGWSVVGVDWVESAIEMATRAAQESDLDTRLLRMTGADQKPNVLTVGTILAL